MDIDFFTFIAQIFNFLLLLYLLRRFLYLPVLKAVEQRQKFIENELEKAAVSSGEAQQLAESCRRKMAEIEMQKQKILSSVETEARILSEKLTQEAQNQFVVAKKQWKNRLQTEKESFEVALQILIIEHFNRFADRAFKQMADVSLNDLILAKLLEKIEKLSLPKKQELIRAYQNKKQIIVQSAQPLETQQRQQLKKFLIEQFTLETETKFKFELKKELICGIAIRSEDQLLEWNLATFMSEFQKHMNDDIQQLVNKG